MALLVCHTSTMFGGESRIYPIQLLVNYWEIQPSQFGAHLDGLLQRGISSLASFVPWQVFESDISHSLTRFLQAASERRMSVTLILSPELGIHAAFSGLPKDVISNRECTARSHNGNEIPVVLPPNVFALPSLLSNAFSKRYYGMLAKMQSFFFDLSKNSENPLRDVTLVLSGSFWKYYRSPRFSSREMFAGSAGDYSKGPTVSYRWCLDEFYGDPEFTDPTPAAANRWKSAAMEEINRRWFFQQSEDVFRVRSQQVIKKRPLSTELRQFEIFAPEADPSSAYSSVLQGITGGNGDFHRLSMNLDSLSTRQTFVGEEEACPFIHWTGLGSFKSLSDSERQFLLIKSLLLSGGRGGGILMDERDWSELSASFRSRMEVLARSLSHGRLKIESRALYLAPHVWSAAGDLWDELQQAVSHQLRVLSSFDALMQDRTARIAYIDEKFILKREKLLQLLQWARHGRVLVLPRSAYYTHHARLELEGIALGGSSLDLNLGVPYKLYPIGEGKLVVYDSPGSEIQSAWKVFATETLSLAGIQSICRFSDSRLSGIPMSFGSAMGGGSMGLFVLNGTNRPVAADIVFNDTVFISDLAVAMSAAPTDPSSGSEGNRFSLEVPPLGVLPLAIDGLVTDHEERHIAGLMARETQEGAMQAAERELGGYNQEAGAPWN